MPPFPITEDKLCDYASFAHETMDVCADTVSLYTRGVRHEMRLRGKPVEILKNGMLSLILDGCKNIEEEAGRTKKVAMPLTGPMLAKLILSLDLTNRRELLFGTYAASSYAGQRIGKNKSWYSFPLATCRNGTFGQDEQTNSLYL